MSELDDLLAKLPISEIAATLGIDESQAATASAAALPSLLKGLQANAQDPAGASSLAQALAEKDPSLVEGNISLQQVDTKDGAKIVKNVFGAKQKDVAAKLGGLGGLDSGAMQKLLGILAPIVLAYLAKKHLGGGSNNGGLLGGLLGNLFGGNKTQSKSKSKSKQNSGGGNDMIGDLIGSVLGGGNDSFGLDDVLGGLLGGGKR